MNEETIAAHLAYNIPKADNFDPQPILPKPISTDEPSGVSGEELGDLVLYKLHDYFGKNYSETNGDDNSRAEYVYRQVGKLIGSEDWVEIITKIHEFEKIAGTKHYNNRLNALYKWLRLDEIRRTTEVEMRLVGDTDE